jgi:hypothetical protein
VGDGSCARASTATDELTVKREVDRSVVVHGYAQQRGAFTDPSYWSRLSRRVEGCHKCGGTLVATDPLPNMLVQECCQCSFTLMTEMRVWNSTGYPRVG